MVEAIESKQRLERVIGKLPLSSRYKFSNYVSGNYQELSLFEKQNFEKMRDLVVNCTSNWWEGSPQEKAFCQYHCPIQVIDFDIYRQAMQILLRRQVLPEELYGENAILIKSEVEEKYFLFNQVMK